MGADPVIVETDGRRAAIGDDEPTASFAVGSDLRGERRAIAAPAGGPVRITAEIERRLGGMTARALLGGTFTPGPGQATAVVVLVAAEGLGFGRPATCASAIGRPLVPGLPEEFAPAVLAALTGAAAALPPGTLTVDRAGHDEVGSSRAAFGLAARVLAAAFSAVLQGRDVAVSAQVELTRD